MKIQALMIYPDGREEITEIEVRDDLMETEEQKHDIG